MFRQIELIIAKIYAIVKILENSEQIKSLDKNLETLKMLVDALNEFSNSLNMIVEV